MGVPDHPHYLSGGRKTKLLKYCEICGTPFEESLSRIQRGHGKYCSRACLYESLQKSITVICKTCGKRFIVKPSKIKKGRGNYCSRKCQGIAQSELYKGRNHPSWKGGLAKCICLECGKEFYIKPSVIKKGGGRYCSRSCVVNALSKKQQGNRSHFWKGGKIKCICIICQKEFYRFPSQVLKSGGKYCSNLCSLKAQRHNTPPKKTHPELIFEEICAKYNLPFRFIGNRSLWVGNANPDFIHNTRKLVCEIYGDYWHSPLLNRNIRPDMTLDNRRKQLKAEGYNLIVLWESDLKRIDAEQFVLYTLAKYKIYPSTT